MERIHVLKGRQGDNMSEIHIPFNEWSRSRLNRGVKTATSRRKRYGTLYDTFKVDGRTYCIIGQCQVRLLDVGMRWFKEEGCESPEEFKEIWKLIHRKAGWEPDLLVWLHTFIEVKGNK